MSADRPSNSVSTYDRVVELLNNASLIQGTEEKLTSLKTVEELILRKEPNLLDNFFDEVSAFQTDRSIDVKKCVVHFLEEAGKVDSELLPRVVLNLQSLFTNENVAVVKRVILSVAQVYRSTFEWIVRAKSISDGMKNAWLNLQSMKTATTELLDSENDGIRTHAIKCLEAIVITLSYKSPESIIPASSANEPSLIDVPKDHAFLKPAKLEEEGRQAFEALVGYQASAHISSVNLMTCMSCMTNIAKQRPGFIERVIQAFESLHVNLPPTLSNSQVSSVRKNLKIQMLALLRLGASHDLQSNITTLLTDLGATQSEVIKNMPRPDEMRKRKAEFSNNSAKKSKIDAALHDDDDDDVDIVPILTSSASSRTAQSSANTMSRSSGTTDVQSAKPAPQQPPKVLSAIDITAEDLVPRMTPQNVADLVLLSMVMLPDTMPASFQATYTPIAAAGTHVQVRHMARLLATQLTAAGFGKGVTETKIQQEAAEAASAKQAEEEEDSANQKQSIATVVGGAVGGGTSGSGPTPSFSQSLPAPTAVLQTTRRGIVPFRLSSITKPVKLPMSEKMAVDSLRRILASEGITSSGNQSTMRIKIITGLVAQFGGTLADVLQAYIFADLRSRTDLAMAWIYHEYTLAQGYDAVSGNKKSNSGYDNCLCRLLSGLLDRPDQKEGLFSRLIMEAPCITKNAIEILKRYCQEETRIYLGMVTLKELILNRPSMKFEILNILLQFASNEKSEVRNNAIRVSKKLHEREDLRDAIEKHALSRLRQLLQSSPPVRLQQDKSDADIKQEAGEGSWTEESIKLCLYLYLGLLPIKHSLIHELALVYTETSADIKRTILRILEIPVKGMGMESPELLLLVENCPRGAETLVTRVIHILTDKAVPSPELVDRVRDLYHKRVADVRFLIPVLNGLTKKEIVSTLPKLIKLNPVVVKEVFNRLLGLQNQSNVSSPISPTELMIALHSLDPNKVDMKTIIKACSICFAEKTVYTQEVLAIVIQQLMDVTPLPTLLMRTVIQALATYPKLIGFAMNIMQRLIMKQVWKQKKVWEGFVKCCQRTKPQSFQVLLQLPAAQLRDVFVICSDLREPLLQHVQAFPPHQRAHISKAIMTVLEKDDINELRAVEDARRAEEDRLAQQEKLYEKKLEDERRRQQESLRQRNGSSSDDRRASIDIKSEAMDDDTYYGGNVTNSEKRSRTSSSSSHNVVQIKNEADSGDRDGIKRSSSHSTSHSSRHHKRN